MQFNKYCYLWVRQLSFLCLITCLLSTSLLAASKKTENRDFIRTEALLFVPDTQFAIGKIVAHAETLGGYFVYETGSQIKLKIPVHGVPLMTKEVGKLGNLVSFNSRRQNLANDLRRLRTSLLAKKESLKDYFKVLKATKTRDDLVAIQREINYLISSIETLKGRIRYQEHQTQFSEFNVSFEQRQTDLALDRKVKSDFEWINRVNVTQLLEGVTK